MGESKQKKKKKQDKKRDKDKTAKAVLAFEEAYERGDFATARKLATGALEGSDAGRAREVLDRIKVDRFPFIVYAACLAFFTLIAFLGLG